MAREDREDPRRQRLIQVGSSDALWLAREAERKPPLLVLAASAQDAERLREEMAWLCPKLRVHRLPDWEILPYDQFSPHPDLISERLQTLWQFANGAFDAGIVPVTTALQRLPPRSQPTAPTSPSCACASSCSTSCAGGMKASRSTGRY